MTVIPRLLKMVSTIYFFAVNVLCFIVENCLLSLNFGANESKLGLNLLKSMVQIWIKFEASFSEFETLHPGGG